MKSSTVFFAIYFFFYQQMLSSMDDLGEKKEPEDSKRKSEASNLATNVSLSDSPFIYVPSEKGSSPKLQKRFQPQK